MSSKSTKPQMTVISIDWDAPPTVPVDPHPGQKSKVMEPVVKAATGEKKVSIFDILGH
jgi:hypothetical protein